MKDFMKKLYFTYSHKMRFTVVYIYIYIYIYMNRIIVDLRNILNFTYPDRSHHDYSNTIATQ